VKNDVEHVVPLSPLASLFTLRRRHLATLALLLWIVGGSTVAANAPLVTAPQVLASN
jgi:hypothetical protein